ncbi:type II toxin-antitoxin system VapC family toxin [Patescibacteria group bacterium]|nr:type II toxin-antitoxin system VapC family toxin [Patescibacteria group bacterium]
MPGESINCIVVDASFILAYLLPDEIFPADKIIKQFKAGELEFISTFLLPFEVLNSLKSAYRQKRVSRIQTRILLKRFFDLEIVLLPVEFEAVFKLAEKKNLTLYDAGYLWLAKNKRVKLQTLDKYLKKISS